VLTPVALGFYKLVPSGTYFKLRMLE